MEISSNEQVDELLKEYTKKLAPTYMQYHENNIELDIPLITSTIFHNTEFLDYSFNDNLDETQNNKKYSDSTINEVKERFDDINELAENMISENKVDEEKYKQFLIETYIPERFSSAYSKQELENIADNIIEDSKYKPEEQEIANNASTIYEECSQVCSTDGRCFDLEEFVTRVVDHESGGFTSFTDKYAEEWKAQAVAARTYTLRTTNYCKSPVQLGINIDILDPSASRSQHDKIKETISSTNGEIMTLNGQIGIGTWDSFYKGNNYHCDDEYCYATYDKVGLTWDGAQQQEIKSYKKWANSFAGGHGKGLSQYGAAYLADIGWDYKQILKYYYADGTEISKLTTVATGTIKGSKYASNAPIYENAAKFYSNVDYNYFLSTSAMPDPQNYGECPWYAQGRALQIVGNSNIPEERKTQILSLLRSTRVNGGDWYYTLHDTILNGSTDIYAAKPGSIVTWASAGQYGHVGIIEDVEYDSSGKASRVLVTESWNGTSNPKNAAYSYSWQSIDSIKKYTGHKHNFIGYTYLLD